jgi:hypothetical protein
MKRSLRASETSFVLSQSLQRRLNMYALAASAAGASILAPAQPAEAKVVSTKTNQTIGYNGVYNLDVNNDGTVDFLIQEWNLGGYASDNALLADPAMGNAVLGYKHVLAAALPFGAPIGPQQPFVAGGGNGEVMVSITHFTTGGTSYVHGYWANVKNRYLGLKFEINGQTRYGWARLSVQRKAFHFTAVLTGYAYETTPNAEIRAGQTSGGTDDFAGASPSPSDNSQSSSLAALALGARERK